MRFLIWIILILACAIAVSLLASHNEGYVLINRPPFRLETSFNFLILMISFGFVFLHLCLRLFIFTRNLPASVRAYKEEKRRSNGHKALIDSLHALVEGRYDICENAAAKALELGEDAGLSALIAARAAHKLKRKSRRDYYLLEAERLAPDALVSRLLTQAELFLDDKQYSQALKVLQSLDKERTNHIPALRLELKIQTRLKNWERVLVIISYLDKSNAISTWETKEVKLQAHQSLIDRYSSDLSALSNYWKSLPDEIRFNERIAVHTSKLFIDANYPDQPAEIIESNLTKKWSSQLSGMLGDCVTSNPSRHLQQAEFWLISHEKDANLLYSLGKMCSRLQLWGKATSYFEASLGIEESPKTHLAIAKLYDLQGEKELANEHYKLTCAFLGNGLA